MSTVVLASYHVIHDSCALGVESVIRRPPDAVGSRTVLQCIRSIVDAKVADKADIIGPLERLLRILCISTVTGELCQPGREKEEVTVRCRVLVGISFVEGKDLPAEATPTSAVLLFIVQTLSLYVPHIDCEIDPFARLGLWEADLSRGHSRQSPDALVVIAQALRLVCRHVGVVVADLELKRFGNYRIVLRISGQEAVVDQGIPDGAGFPEVVVLRVKEAGNKVRLETGVV
jgi:hypothetical protein